MVDCENTFSDKRKKHSNAAATRTVILLKIPSIETKFMQFKRTIKYSIL